VPFLEHVHGNSTRALHMPGSYYNEHVYAARSVQRAGGLLVAGSDAPVETRDPRPFVNIARAMTRRVPGGPSLNAAQDLSLTEALDAYTISGARFLGRAQDIGSLEPGKSADFIIIDRDPFALAAHGHADDIANIRVLNTYFMGREVYAR
jgi:predicted amidohydrolase YtcJ